MQAVYTYYDATGIQKSAEADQFNFLGAWSSTGTYFALTHDTVDYNNGQFTCIITNSGSNPLANADTWSPLVLRTPASTQITNATVLATGSQLNVTGTNTGTGVNVTIPTDGLYLATYYIQTTVISSGLVSAYASWNDGIQTITQFLNGIDIGEFDYVAGVPLTTFAKSGTPLTIFAVGPAVVPPGAFSIYATVLKID